MPAAPDGLTAAQRAVTVWHGRALLVSGERGSGRTRALVARAARLAEAGLRPERMLVLGVAPAGAAMLRGRLEAALTQPYDELHVLSPLAFASRLLAQERGDELPPAGRAERLAALLRRIDDLPLREHDLGGNPARALAALVARVDALKAAGALPHVPDDDPGAPAAGARAADAERASAVRAREFAALFAAHDRVLAQARLRHPGDVVADAIALLRARPDVRARAGREFPQVLVDDLDAASPIAALFVGLLEGDGVEVVATAASATVPTAAAGLREAERIDLGASRRGPARVVAAAAAPDLLAPADGVAFWRCEGERAQAQAVAADVERAWLASEEAGAEGDVGPDARGSIAVLVRSVRDEGQAVAVALEERGVPHRVLDAGAFFERSEVRDVLAWLRLLADPGDASAVARALVRPPVELRSIDLARCLQIARRRKLDLVAALFAATESPQLPPEARERIRVFLSLHRSAAAALDTMRPDLYVHRLIERIGLRRQQLFAAQASVVERLLSLARVAELATDYVQRDPQATPREFARHLASVAEAGVGVEEPAGVPRGDAVAVMAMEAARGLEFDAVYVLGLTAQRHPAAADDARTDAPGEDLLDVALTRARRRLVLSWPQLAPDGVERPPAPRVDALRTALGQDWEPHGEELFGPAESLHATYRVLRDELLASVSRVGVRLGELRFDTDLDVAHAVTRYLELLKVAALIQRPPGQTVAEALPDISARLVAAATAQQREILETSALDDYLIAAERDARRRAKAMAARDEPSLAPFLPRRGDGLALSASDIETYLACPLRYKFARVLRIPQEPTVNQRFGIVVHQVLERFHQAGGTPGLEHLLGLLDGAWRRGGLGDSEQERQLRSKATSALTRYHERVLAEAAEPVWFERAFTFAVGRHRLRGRVDRVDRLEDGRFELIDYKTGRPKTPAQIETDVQLAVYALGAREAWQLDATEQAYLYVLDDVKVPLAPGAADEDWISDTVIEVGAGIESQGFEPTPSPVVCGMCDYRLMCPAAER